MLAAVVVALPIGSPALAAPGDQPSVHQYSDPFAPLGTGHRTPAWTPFSRDFREAVPPQVRRRLAKAKGGPALELLLAQLQTERARTGERSRGEAAAAGGVRREDDEPGATSSAVSSVLDGGGLGAALLFAGLGAIAAGGAAAAWTRRRQYAAGSRGR